MLVLPNYAQNYAGTMDSSLIGMILFTENTRQMKFLKIIIASL